MSDYDIISSDNDDCGDNNNITITRTVNLLFYLKSFFSAQYLVRFQPQTHLDKDNFANNKTSDEGWFAAMHFKFSSLLFILTLYYSSGFKIINRRT